MNFDSKGVRRGAARRRRDSNSARTRHGATAPLTRSHSLHFRRVMYEASLVLSHALHYSQYIQGFSHPYPSVQSPNWNCNLHTTTLEGCKAHLGHPHFLFLLICSLGSLHEHFDTQLSIKRGSHNLAAPPFSLQNNIHVLQLPSSFAGMEPIRVEIGIAYSLLPRQRDYVSVGLAVWNWVLWSRRRRRRRV